VASTRKFDDHGDWHFFTTLLALPLRMLLRTRGADALIERYWYDPRR
jgi:hypothetical protein